MKLLNQDVQSLKTLIQKDSVVLQAKWYEIRGAQTYASRLLLYSGTENVVVVFLLEFVGCSIRIKWGKKKFFLGDFLYPQYIKPHKQITIKYAL